MACLRSAARRHRSADAADGRSSSSAIPCSRRNVERIMPEGTGRAMMAATPRRVTVSENPSAIGRAKW